MEKENNIQLGVYKHFKGKLVEVIGIAHHSETLEKMVIYKELDVSAEFGKNSLWVRPLPMFLEKVNREGTEIPRFTYQCKSRIKE